MTEFAIIMKNASEERDRSRCAYGVIKQPELTVVAIKEHGRNSSPCLEREFSCRHWADAGQPFRRRRFAVNVAAREARGQMAW